ncbi:Gfo/Idh/MocA family protein [Zavarzinella formosa]|uniref:Gfo/Idh/MocA family protein n=1 Tax=Zavarzinella formosa TaxID=360055 RepID=UPI0003053D96|nr:Gfo/Idh/MocA family oxidoreductase [Zavarzinella formosa]
MRATGVVVVGTGFIGPVHVEALRRLGRNILGVLGSTPEKSRAAREAMNLPKAYSTYEEVLADPNVAVVHLTSPNRHHYEQCKQAIAAGKHVVCEKPLAMTSVETASLVRLAVAASVVTAVNYNVRYYPVCLEARERRIAGRLGPIYHVTGSYMQDWLLHDTDFNWRVLAAEGGELRAMADIGTHWLDLIQFITGLEVESLCADLATIHPIRKSVQGSVETFQAVDQNRPFKGIPVDTEDYGSVLLRFVGGTRGAVTVSQVTAGRKNCIRFDIAASQCGLAWNSEEPNTLQIGRRDNPNEELARDPALLSPTVRPFANYPGGHAEGFPDSFKQLFRAVYEAIDTGKSMIPYPTFADGDREVRLCEAILKSHREQRWVRVE